MSSNINEQASVLVPGVVDADQDGLCDTCYSDVDPETGLCTNPLCRYSIRT